MKNLLFVISLLFLISVPAGAQKRLSDADAGGVIERIALRNKEHQTIVCDFVQVRHVAVLDHDIVSRGRYYYRRDGYMCMAYSDPEGNVMLMNPDILLIVENGRRSALQKDSTPFAKQMRKMLTACMAGDIAHLGLSSRSKISVVESDDFYEVSVESSRNKYVLQFNSSDLTLRKLIFNNVNGDFTEYSFSDVSVNSPVDDSVFSPDRY